MGVIFVSILIGLIVQVCPILCQQCSITGNNDKVPIVINNELSSAIVIGANFSGKCKWELRPPDERNDMILILNVTQIECKDKFKINEAKKCNGNTPFVYMHIPSTCNSSKCESDDGKCDDESGYPMELSFHKNEDNINFSLEYKFIPCYTTTIPIQPTTASSTEAESTTVETDYIANSSPTSTEEATTLKKDNENSTLPLTESPTSPTIASGSSQLLSIFIPIVIILLLAILFLLVVLKIRHKKLVVEQARKAGRHQAQTTNVTAEQGYEPIDSDKDQLPGIAFGNQAYQTVISNEDQTGSYAVIEDGAVYYSPVNGESGTNQQTGSGTPTTTTYDQVAGDEIGIQNDGPPHSYEEVTLQVAQGNEKQEVDNILYGEN